MLDKYFRHVSVTTGSKLAESPAFAKSYEIRLKPLERVSDICLTNVAGSFMVQGEEDDVISAEGETNTHERDPTCSRRRFEPLRWRQQFAKSMAKPTCARLQSAGEDRLGRQIMMHLNHPNFGITPSPPKTSRPPSQRNVSSRSTTVILPSKPSRAINSHPGVERLWDIANTIRLGELSEPPLFGVATDDSHDYHTPRGSRVGRGWIMVRSRYLTPEHVIRGMRAGDFYASSGVSLNDVAYDSETRTLRIEIAAEEGVAYTTEIVGTLKGYDKKSEPRVDADGKEIEGTRKYSADVGKTLAKLAGPKIEYQLTGEELYVRAVITSSEHHHDPSFGHQHQQAWTQPVGWKVSE